MPQASQTVEHLEKAHLSTRPGLGERVRQLRIASGQTQAQLAGERFSKEYISQIERGKTRPTAETIDWLAQRLGVDAAFLEHGVSADQRARVEARLARAEALVESHRYEEAVQEFSGLRPDVAATGLASVEVRILSGEARARVYRGEVRDALSLLSKARSIAEGPTFSDVERAEILFQIGVCRYKLSSISTALSLFDEALNLAERSGLPCDLLRSDIFGWRSRCYRRRRDFEAAREDVERSLELANGMQDPRRLANVYFYASLVAERQGHWILARSYAERAKRFYEEISDRANVGRLLNNLGGLNFVLGKPADAVSCLKEAFQVALEVGSDADAAQAISSLARVNLRTGQVQLAEGQARQALQLLGERVDFLDEIGQAHLVLGRSLTEQDRLSEAEEALQLAERSFEGLSSVSHRAAAWVAQGDLAGRAGDQHAAARLYKRAAEALQDLPDVP